MIQYLADHLGIPTSNARILYDQWLENTLNSLSNGKPVTIEGLGSFTFDNNELKFAPQPNLELDVNRAYAGLEPLPETKLGPAKFSESDFDDPFMDIIAPKFPEVQAETNSNEPEPEPEPLANEPEPEPVAEELDAPAEPDAPVNRMPWVTAAVVLLILAVGGYVGIGYYESWMESKLAAEQAATTPVDEPSASVEPVASYGLTGTPSVLEGRVYGIIVHSLPVKADSEAQCAEISRLGLRCSVVTAIRNGATTYRVAIGQFESTADAQAAVTDLPANYQSPGNYFISRIQ